MWDSAGLEQHNYFYFIMANIPDDIKELVLEKIATTKLKDHKDLAFEIVEYGRFAGQAYGHLKKLGEKLIKIFDETSLNDKRTREHIKQLILYGYSEKDRKLIDVQIPRPLKDVVTNANIPDEHDAMRKAKIRLHKNLSRQVCQVLDYCYPPPKLESGIKRARKEEPTKAAAAESKPQGGAEVKQGKYFHLK